MTAILTNLAKPVSEKVKSRHQNVKGATIEFRVIDGQPMQISQNLLLHKTDNSSQLLLFNDMEMSDPEFYNLAKTAKQSQLMSRYWMTNNKNISNSNKYNRNDCGRSSLDCVTKKPGQGIKTNWEQTSKL